MALQAIPETAKTVNIYRNGDTHYTGKKFVVNKKQLKTFDAFLNNVTIGIRAPFGAVRRIHTPTGRHLVKDIDELEQGQNYVATGLERFKKLQYLEISEVPKKSTSPRFPEVRPVEHSRIKVSGRFRKIRTEVTPILVYANGDALRAPARILLRANEMRSWQQILNVITDKVELRTGATRWIYSMDGQVVTRPSDLEKEGKYVAVGSEKNFKELPYTEDKVPYMSGAASPRQQQKYSPGKLPPIKRVRKSDGGTNSTRNSTGSSETSDKSKAKSKRVSPKKEDDQVFHAKPVKHKRTTRQVDLDKDEGGVFKARHVRDRDAREIEESKDTRVDLPIDQVEAEEIKDEEIEDTSKSISSDKELKKNPSDEKDKDLAAIKIQSGYRGHKARKQYKARKVEKHVKKERDTPPVRSSNPVPPVKPTAKQHDQPKIGQKKYAVLPPTVQVFSKLTPCHAVEMPAALRVHRDRCTPALRLCAERSSCSQRQRFYCLASA
ncbi:unnamed protein product [Owenia fusiformis]|uniref:Doublecortin domain-containing protein n=1 Tax=Owenia fusiformis TaxID=6347 RepID=A0A8S4N0J1_OWEFU|nr:unnamed protein product [Owenia fusiformis]